MLDNPATPIEQQPETVTLYRPVGPKELALIRATDWREFPSRLPEQPIFYPVLNEEYATQIARDWNVSASGSGYVTRFKVRTAFLRNYEVKTVGGRLHQEYWIPAIVEPITVVTEFHAPDE